MVVAGPPTSTSTVSYLYYDAHGNLAAEANTSGSQTGNHTYDPFGAPTDTIPTNTSIHRFTGRWNKQYDTADSLILMGARPYDPTTGRFLSVDPLPGGSLNNYDYAGQDPINNYDLSGTVLEAVPPGNDVHDDAPQICKVTGCGAGLGNTNPTGISWRRTVKATAMVLAVVAAPEILTYAWEESAATRGLLERATRGDAADKLIARKALARRIRHALVAAGGVDATQATGPRSVFEKFAVAFIRWFIRGH